MLKCGIDIGGTTIKGALFDGRPVPLKFVSAETKGRMGREKILEQLFSVLDDLTAGLPEFIGISSAGNIDPYKGTCVYATDNLSGWTGTEIKKIVEKRYSIPCKADNDAICALKGELVFHEGVKDATMLTFGTGVGGASLVGGTILRGKDFAGGRWGHFCLEPNGNRCNCGKTGCAETYLSGNALLKEGRKELPLLKDTEELFALYRDGNEPAKKVIENFGLYLRRLLTEIRTILSPELIILGGGVMKSEDIVRSLLCGADEGITFAKLGNLSGAYGAANL